MTIHATYTIFGVKMSQIETYLWLCNFDQEFKEKTIGICKKLLIKINYIEEKSESDDILSIMSKIDDESDDKKINKKNEKTRKTLVHNYELISEIDEYLSSTKPFKRLFHGKITHDIDPDCPYVIGKEIPDGKTMDELIEFIKNTQDQLIELGVDQSSIRTHTVQDDCECCN